jgi:DNA-binding CsgD family transcriptional regulator
MARRREGTVRESAATLEALASRYSGTQFETRVRMLLALRLEPAATMRELSTRLDRCERQLRRWWSEYCRDGLEGLLGKEPDARPIEQRAQFTRAEIAATHAHHSGPIPAPAALLRFLNAMPTTDDPDLWMVQFHASLKSLLHGVDMLILNINQASSADECTSEKVVMVGRQHEANGLGKRRTAIATALDRSPGEITVAQAAQRGFPVAHYQPPHIVDYYVNDGCYVGTVVLWRERSAGTPIPRSTIELLESLHGFIAFAFSDCMSRRLAHDPELKIFRDVIDKTAERIGLTEREIEVFVLNLLGIGRKEIAVRLRISEAAVGKRTASIYRKAGTSTLTELFLPL